MGDNDCECNKKIMAYGKISILWLEIYNYI